MCIRDRHRRTRQEVIERLLLDRVDAESARATVRRQHDGVVLARANEAEPALALLEATRARTQITLNSAVGETAPVLRREHVRALFLLLVGHDAGGIHVTTGEGYVDGSVLLQWLGCSIRSMR